ncbi:TetR/AcrR family transcriptional regulator [Microbacterium gorillae]|uniref:TetR/AcrR family transcriptional regulator n=1 Tax=Microbacterium gorillae TaxID=1231063 RepID=UPI0006932DFE|nr:TetR/AcrR family transcriptional regulator [Microbacterium gorillae]
MAEETDRSTVRHGRAEATRAKLLASARVLFARGGYAATTMRDIASDADVNVALVNRYFESKEKLFQLCLAQVDTELNEEMFAQSASTEAVLRRIASHVMAPQDTRVALRLRLLFQASGDAEAERIRLETLRGFIDRLLLVGGDQPVSPEREVRAHLALGLVIGSVLLREEGRLEMVSRDAPDLLESELVGTLAHLLAN